METSAVGLAPVRIGRHRNLAVDEHEALAAVLVDAECNGAPSNPARLTARR